LVTELQQLAIAIVKQMTLQLEKMMCYSVGDVVTHTFIVTNPGNVSLNTINVVDTHPGLSAIALQSACQ
jgi:hypothetical protein